MLAVGQTLSLAIEKPAVGGRMIARVDGQVVLVDGAIPGERVVARIERIGRGVAFAQTIEPELASPDRRGIAVDRLCGGCLYAHIAYERQLEIKAQVIRDAFVRIGRLPAPDVSAVAASPVRGYRMRARLHVRNRRIGFFREGTHEVCDARSSGQLLPRRATSSSVSRPRCGLPREVPARSRLQKTWTLRSASCILLDRATWRATEAGLSRCWLPAA